jgi:outer membrane biosynthesis protein TonB
MASVGKFTSGRKPDGAGNFGILLGALGGTVLFLVGGFALLGALSPGDQTEAQFFRNDFDKTPQTTAEKTVPQKKAAIAPKQQSATARPELKEVPKQQVVAPPPVQQQVQQPEPQKIDPVTTGTIQNQQPVVQTPAPKQTVPVRQQRPRAQPLPKREVPKHTTNPFLQLFGG